MTTALPQAKPSEDPLAHLPKANTHEFRKGQVIYSTTEPSERVYLVTEGKVMVSRMINEDKQVLMDICQPPELFGESALVNCSSQYEQAVALENTKVMSWTAADIIDSVTRQTRLGMVLLQSLSRRESELTWRMQSLAVDTIHLRVARSLIRLSERLGRVREDGSVHLPPLTHKMISQFVGSTREIVTHHMTEFRKLGYLNYSRTGIIIYRDALMEWVQRNSPGRFSAHA